MKRLLSIFPALFFYLSAFSQEKVPVAAIPEEPRDMTLRQFDKRVRKAKRPLLMFFTAGWCPVCTKQDSLVRRIFIENSEHMELVILDMEANAAVSHYFEVNALPVLILYVNGYLVWLQVGFQQKEQILEPLNLFIPSP